MPLIIAETPAAFEMCAECAEKQGARIHKDRYVLMYDGICDDCQQPARVCDSREYVSGLFTEGD